VSVRSTAKCVYSPDQVFSSLARDLFGAAGAWRCLPAVGRWCSLYLLKLTSVDDLVRVLLALTGEDSGLFFDARRRVLEVCKNGVQVRLTPREVQIVVGAGYSDSTEWKFTPPAPRALLRNRGTVQQHLDFDRTGTVLVRREHARSFFAALDRRLLALHVVTALEALAGEARAADCQRGWLACPLASSLTRLYSHTDQPSVAQPLVDVAELLRAHGDGNSAWRAVVSRL
jgi:hypothetical protein